MRRRERIEVYDNSHIQGTNAVGAMIVAGPEGFVKNQYRKFNIKNAELDARRRFRDDARGADAALQAADEGARGSGGRRRCAAGVRREGRDEDARSAATLPDLVLIDGGAGQLSVACEVLAALGVSGVKLVAIAKGPDRDAGREHFFMAGRASRFSSSSRARCCSICNGCATRRIASPSARIAPSGRRRSRPRRSTKSKESGRRASGRLLEPLRLRAGGDEGGAFRPRIG